MTEREAASESVSGRMDLLLVEVVVLQRFNPRPVVLLVEPEPRVRLYSRECYS